MQYPPQQATEALPVIYLCSRTTSSGLSASREQSALKAALTLCQTHADHRLLSHLPNAIHWSHSATAPLLPFTLCSQSLIQQCESLHLQTEMEQFSTSVLNKASECCHSSGYVCQANKNQWGEHASWWSAEARPPVTTSWYAVLTCRTLSHDDTDMKP